MYRDKKKEIIDYIERLSVLDRQVLPVAASSSVAAATEPVVANQSEAALIACLGKILEIYNEQRVRKDYIKSLKTDRTRESYQKFYAQTDQEDINSLLNDSSVSDATLIPGIVKFYMARVISGDKSAIKSKFEGALSDLYGSANSSTVKTVTKEDLLQLIVNYKLDKANRDDQEIKAYQEKNNALIIEACEGLARIATTYYTRLSGVAYNSSKKKIEREGKVSEAECLKYLDSRYQNPISERAEDDRAPASKQSKPSTGKATESAELINNIEGLFDYAEVQDPIPNKSGHRDNDKAKLIFLMARHLHIVIHVYPEMIKEYGSEFYNNEKFDIQIIQPFVQRVLSETWTSLKHYVNLSFDVNKQIRLFATQNKAVKSQLDALESSTSGSGTNSDEEVSEISISKMSR